MNSLKVGCSVIHGTDPFTAAGWVLLILALGIPAKAILGGKASG